MTGIAEIGGDSHHNSEEVKKHKRDLFLRVWAPVGRILSDINFHYPFAIVFLCVQQLIV